MSSEGVNVVELARRGDRRAFRQLYQEHVGRVYAVCLRLLGDRAKAEDACQEVFIKIWQQLPGFRGDSSFSTWLHAIATRTAIDTWRKDRMLRLTDSSDSAPEASEEPAHGDHEDLEQGMRQLPAQARMVFVLFALEGYRHQEIGRLLGIAEGSSKSQYHRARQQLKEYLGEP